GRAQVKIGIPPPVLKAFVVPVTAGVPPPSTLRPGLKVRTGRPRSQGHDGGLIRSTGRTRNVIALPIYMITHCRNGAPTRSFVSTACRLKSRRRIARGGYGDLTTRAGSERQPDPEHLYRVERQFPVQAAFDVVGLAKAMLLAGEQEVAHRVPLAPQRVDHDFSL